MSWLAEIAGKAEDFLNKIDQNAAVALSTLEEVGQSRSKVSKSKTSVDTVQSDGGYDIHFISNVASDRNFNNAVDTSSTMIESIIESNISVPPIVQPNKTPQTLRSKSRPGAKVKHDATEQSADGGHGLMTTIPTVNGSKLKTDDELLQFLNSPERKEIDETALLKSELSTQSREMGMLLKNHRKLQQDFEHQNTTLEELRKCLSDKQSNVDSKQQNDQEIKRLASIVTEKDKELTNLKVSLDETLEKVKGLDDLLELQNRIQQLELESHQFETRNGDLEEKVQDLAEQLSVAEHQVISSRDALAAVEHEFSVYKEKAKSILKGKDELILSIKNQSKSANDVGGSIGAFSDSQIMAEIGGLKNERELLHGEISQSRSLCDSLKDENRRLESEIHSVRSSLSELQETYSRDRMISHSIQEENLQLSQKVSSLQLEVEQEKSNKRKLEERVKRLTYDLEQGFSSISRKSSASPVEFMRPVNSVASKPRTDLNNSPIQFSNNPDENENLKTRIKALSQSLMEKQSLINNISADKQLLQIRVERLQAQIQELTESSESSTHQSLTTAVISSQPLYLSESPWDSGVTTRVKRVYSRVDSLCCQFGLAMRHRPNLRLGFSLYIMFLHLWVFFILFYWSHSAPIHPYR